MLSAAVREKSTPPCDADRNKGGKDRVLASLKNSDTSLAKVHKPSQGYEPGTQPWLGFLGGDILCWDPTLTGGGINKIPGLAFILFKV